MRRKANLILKSALALGTASCEVHYPNTNPDVGVTTENPTRVKPIELTPVLWKLSPNALNRVTARSTTKNKGFPVNAGNKSNDFDSSNEELSIRFAPRDYTLHPNDTLDLSNFSKINTSKNFVVEGHADYLSKDISNDVFARNRAQNVANYIKRKVKGAKIIIAECGSNSNTQESSLAVSFERQAVIHTGDVIDHLLSKVGGTHYLIDSSESMNARLGEHSKWSQIVNHVFRPEAKVYTYRNSKVDLKSLAAHTPSGNSTPLFSALHELIKIAKFGESITIVTDGNDNGSKVTDNYATVIKAANSKQVNISVIGLGDATDRDGLKLLARNTRGVWCFTREHEVK